VIGLASVTLRIASGSIVAANILTLATQCLGSGRAPSRPARPTERRHRPATTRRGGACARGEREGLPGPAVDAYIVVHVGDLVLFLQMAGGSISARANEPHAQSRGHGGRFNFDRRPFARAKRSPGPSPRVTDHIGRRRRRRALRYARRDAPP
jgi:hypothetical protein